MHDAVRKAAGTSIPISGVNLDAKICYVALPCVTAVSWGLSKEVVAPFQVPGGGIYLSYKAEVTSICDVFELSIWPLACVVVTLERRVQGLVALLLGTGLSIGGFARVWITTHDIVSASAITASLLMIVMVSIIVGTMLPYAFAGLKVDPAHGGTTIQVSLQRYPLFSSRSMILRCMLWLGLGSGFVPYFELPERSLAAHSSSSC